MIMSTLIKEAKKWYDKTENKYFLQLEVGSVLNIYVG